jgi:putative YphP/YqiW family bacilliredoxin
MPKSNKNRTRKQTTFVVINSVCGCAAANARPAAKIAASNGKEQAKLVTVFAEMERRS